MKSVTAVRYVRSAIWREGLLENGQKQGRYAACSYLFSLEKGHK